MTSHVKALPPAPSDRAGAGGGAGILAALACAAVLAAASPPARAAGFASAWRSMPDRVWVGPDCWANRLQDWRVAGGRLECTEARPREPLRTVHLVTCRLAAGDGDLSMRVRTGTAGRRTVSAASATGFLLGAGRGELDYRAAALVHHSGGPGAGILAAVDGAGKVFFRDLERRGEVRPARGAAAFPGPLRLELAARPRGNPGGVFALELTARDDATGKVLDRATLDVPEERLRGSIALVSHPGKGKASGRFWFADWQVAGSKVRRDPARASGPIISAQYTLSRRILKLTAQLMPIGPGDPQTVALEVRGSGGWRRMATAEVIAPGWTATFRVPGWDDSKDIPYRVVYGAQARTGLIRHDPVEEETIVVAGFTGNHNVRRGVESGRFDWLHNVWFPHADLTEKVLVHDPDLLFFSGDQIYEGASPTHPDRARIKLDYLYKWYLWCWAYRDLAAKRPCVTIPDDHDVYQGNLWGEGGRRTDKDDKGGYVHPADFVKMVERTQTSDLPDPFDPTPIKQGIGVYYTSLTWGRISFAILEDRKFKSGCNGRVPPSGSKRADHITNPDFDVRRADVPGLSLLGKRQLRFLRHWAADWSGADMKVALSQTIFAGAATHHGPRLEYLRADLDSNGWPQSGRNRALRELRRCFAFHLAGDQHLATIIHHGIDDWNDAIWSFAVPSIANFYPRMWKPKEPGKNREPGAPEYTGEFLDGLGNHITVYAATNPGKPMGHEPAALHDRMPGYAIVRLDRAARTITMECWPRFADPRDPSARQYEGWPRTIRQLDADGRRPAAFLPEIRVKGMRDPVIEVIDERTRGLVSALRIRGTSFRPPVFARGTYTVIVGEPATGRFQTLRGLTAQAGGGRTVIEVEP